MGGNLECIWFTFLFSSVVDMFCHYNYTYLCRIFQEIFLFNVLNFHTNPNENSTIIR